MSPKLKAWMIASVLGVVICVVSWVLLVMFDVPDGMDLLAVPFGMVMVLPLSGALEYHFMQRLAPDPAVEALREKLAKRGMSFRHHKTSVTIRYGRHFEEIPLDVVHVDYSFATGLQEGDFLRKSTSQVLNSRGDAIDVETLPIPRPPFEGLGASLKNADAYGREELLGWIEGDRQLAYLIEGVCESHSDVHIAHDFVVVAAVDDGYGASVELTIDSIVALLERMRKGHED